MSYYYPPNAFVLGDVRYKFIHLRRKFSAGLVFSHSDKICLYTAMYIGPIRPSVTEPYYGPVTLGRIPDRPYLQETNVIRQCSFYVIFMSCYFPPNAFVLGDVRWKYIPVRSKSSARGLVISPPDR